MKYASIDIETTGLNSLEHKILSIGIILEDSDNIQSFETIPKLHIAVTRNNEDITGSIFAINMNKDLISLINDYQNAKSNDDKIRIENNNEMMFIPENNIVSTICSFLYSNGYKRDDNGKFNIVVAGKNFGTFDKPFLTKLPFFDNYINVNHRIIDPSTYYIDWENDTIPPSLSQCKQRAGYNNIVTHNAIDDAWDVILLLRRHYKKY